MSQIIDKRIDYLDGFRGFAILLVILGHGSRLISEENLFRKSFLVIGNEHLGVQIFFVLSGFLITRLIINEYNKTGNFDIKKFFLKRVLRIFPVYYFYIIIIMILVFAGFIYIDSSPFFIASFYLFNYRHLFPADVTVDEWYLAHTWSLAMEEQFYLIWPALILIFSIKNMLRVVVILLVLFPFFRLINYYVLPETRGLMKYMMHTGGDCLLYGCFGALVTEFYSEKVQKYLMIIDKYKIYIFLSLYLFVLSPVLIPYLLGTKSGFFTPSLNPLCIIILMLWLIQSGKLWNVFNNKYIMLLGVYSYSIYIWQQLFLTTLNKNLLGMFPINYIAIAVMAWLSYNLIEKQFLKLKNKI